MKNVTLSTSFFTDMLALSPETQLRVLAICQQLAAGDEDTIEQFQLPADSPDVLVDFVKRLKRRVRAARRRRQRAATQPKTAKKTEPTHTPQPARPNEVMEPTSFEHATKMFEASANYIILGATHADDDTCLWLEDISVRVNQVICDRCYFIHKKSSRNYRYY